MAKQYRQLGAVAEEVLIEQRKRQENRNKFKPKLLGLKDCDVLLDGYDPHWYVCVGGKAKAGKTTFVLHSAITLATQELKVLYAPLEERARQVAIRAMSRMSTKIRRSDFRNLHITDEGFDELDSYVRQLKELHFVITEGEMKAEELFQALAKLKDDQKPDLLVVDYLQLFQDYPTRSMAERSDAISAVMMRIRNELGIGVLCSFQLGDKGKRQYGGTSVYRDADVILHLEQKKDAATGQDSPKLLQVTVMPSREVGEGHFELTFSGAHSRVTDVRPKVPDLLMDPNDIESEEAYETELGLVPEIAESN